MSVEKISSLVQDYLKALDDAIDLLSNKDEGKLAGLMSWVLSNRKIYIAPVQNHGYYFIKIVPDKLLEKDLYETVVLQSEKEIDNFTHPFTFDKKFNFSGALQYGDMNLTELNEAGKKTVFEFKGVIILISTDHLFNEFNVVKAKQTASDIWNNINNGFNNNLSFVTNVQSILDRFQNMIKKKSFLERRIHRFINAHPSILLPAHKKIFFEQKLYKGDDFRVADFILQTETGFSPYLIELESPVNKLFLKNGELTRGANHAKNQISEWDAYIDEDERNRIGELSFLDSKRLRLIIMGRDILNEDKIRFEAKHNNTIVWSYETLIKEMKQSWNEKIERDGLLLGFNPEEKLK